jgi:hypothetical protein
MRGREGVREVVAGAWCSFRSGRKMDGARNLGRSGGEGGRHLKVGSIFVLFGHRSAVCLPDE